MDWNEVKISPKYGKWILASEINIFNILEGGVRSGKTTTLIISFCRALERVTYDAIHVAFAENIGLSRAILGEGGNGLGIKNYFGENAKEGKYKNHDALFIKIRNTTQIVIFVGSGKSDSFQKIRGLTITCVIGTEINLAHPSFLDEIIARTLSTNIKYRRLFFDLNPSYSKSSVYVDYLDPWIERSNAGLMSVNYLVVSLYDNPIFTDEEIEAIKGQYDPNSSFYKSLILGLRVSNLNTIYTFYEHNKSAILPSPLRYIISCDIGVSTSATVYLCGGIAADGKIYIYDMYWHRNGPKSIQGAKTYDDYADDLVGFYNKQISRFGTHPLYVFIDRDISMLRILTKKFIENEISMNKIQYCIKDKILDRIINLSSALFTGRLVISETLPEIQIAIESAVYDEKSSGDKLIRKDDVNLKNNPIDIIDTLDYLLSYFLKYEIKT